MLDLANAPDAWKDFAPRTVAAIVDASANASPDSSGLPRVSVTIDGEVYLGSWRKLEGRVVSASGAGELDKIVEYEWLQKGGPKTVIPSELFKNSDLWLFLMKPGNYAFTFRARNGKGWSAASEIRFAVLPGRPYVSAQDGFQRVGSCERVLLPGQGWRQIAGPPAAFRPAENGVAVRPNDAGLYVFEAPRIGLEYGVPERRGILVPPGTDAKLGDRRPIANLPKAAAGATGRPVVLDGSLSMDPDTEDVPKLTARWSNPGARPGTSLEAQPGLRAVFKSDRPGSFTAALVVSDGRLDSLPATIAIEITDDADPRGGNFLNIAGSDGDADWDAKDLALHPVSLAIWPAEPLADGTLIVGNDTGLERAVQAFPNRCGVALMIDPGVARPGHFHEFQLALEADKTPLRHLLDGIARQTGTRYRRNADRAFWLLRPDDSFKDEPLEPVAAGVDALFEKPDASDLLAPMKEYLKPMLAREGTSIGYEAEQKALVAMLPKTACVRLREIVQALREPAGIGLPYPEAPSKAEERLSKLLGEKTVTMRGRYRLDRLLRDVARDAGLSIGFDPKAFPDGAPYMKIAFENTPLRQVFRDVVEEAGFDGCSVEAPGGIWFYKGPRPFPTGELLWDSVEVRAYDLTTLFAALSPDAALLLSGEAIAHSVRSRVYPASWKDPGVCVFYHRGTRKLVVVHAPQAQRKVVELLNDLRERGEWALGASE